MTSKQTPILLELQYLPPIQYFTKLYHHTVYLEQHENYRKGTYRNRCHIASANGLLRLSIPLQKGKNQRQPIQNVRIAYDQPWQSQHWSSIQSAYGNAPFFEYYVDELQPFFKKKYEFLWDWNLDLLKKLVELTGLEEGFQYTDQFYKVPPLGWLDSRNKINPKLKVQNFETYPYRQVFEEKHGFIPNLSILDLLPKIFLQLSTQKLIFQDKNPQKSSKSHFRHLNLFPKLFGQDIISHSIKRSIQD